MPPANECFNTCNATTGQVGLGLIEELQLVLLDSRAQLGGQRQTVRTVLVELWRIQAELALIAFGNVHGNISATQQRAGIGPVIGLSKPKAPDYLAGSHLR